MLRDFEMSHQMRPHRKCQHHFHKPVQAQHSRRALLVGQKELLVDLSARDGSVFCQFLLLC